MMAVLFLSPLIILLLLLTTVTDQSGRALIRNRYDGTRVVQQTYPNGVTCRFRYTWADNKAYVTEASLLPWDGTVRSIRTADAAPRFLVDYKR